MADLLRIKNNVSKMVGMGAPESDIDQYISGEGSSVDEIKNFRPSPTLPERAKTAMAYGLPAAVAGERTGDLNKTINAQAPNIYQGAGNIIGAGVGAVATLPTGGIVNPESGAAMGGAVGRGGYEAYRQVLDKEPFSLPKIKHEFQTGMTGELLGHGIVKGLQKAVPWSAKTAKDLILSYLKPKGELAEKGGEIAKTILDEGLAKGNMGEMLSSASDKAQKLTQQVDDIISKYAGRQGNAKAALARLDGLASEYHQAGDPQSAEAINKLKENLIQGRTLNQPVKGSVSSTESLGIPTVRENQIIGEEPRPVNVDELQDIKRQQYRTLARKRRGGGYGAEVKSAEIEGRQDYASGIKKEIENAIPEEDIAGKNDRVSRMIDTVKALQDREPISGRKNVLDLGDLILGGTSFSNPNALGALAIKKSFGDSGKNFAADTLYDYSKDLGPTLASVIKNRYVRPLVGTSASSVLSKTFKE